MNSWDPNGSSTLFCQLFLLSCPMGPFIIISASLHWDSYQFLALVYTTFGMAFGKFAKLLSYLLCLKQLLKYPQKLHTDPARKYWTDKERFMKMMEGLHKPCSPTEFCIMGLIWKLELRSLNDRRFEKLGISVTDISVIEMPHDLCVP